MATVTQWCKEIVLALEFVHGHNIIHRDIKPASVEFLFHIAFILPVSNSLMLLENIETC